MMKKGREAAKARLALIMTVACAFAFNASSEVRAGPLYEKLEVFGVMDCVVDGDIRLAVSEERVLHCDFVRRGQPGQLKRYLGRALEVKPAVAVADDDFICWTALLLRKDGAPDIDGAAGVKGAYRSASGALAEEYGLKENTLVGGAEKTFALEPRCTAERAGRNIAEAVLRFELGD